MIVGTAGHIDHGKTTLVRALSGVDTDRLPEEKARGISIELGYAYTPLANGDVLGFVDVPGHEKFVSTMLAGASGIDFALMVVAADDGVMPQTREHLNILTLLGVAHGAIALTKIDAVDAARIDEVEVELRRLVRHTMLADAPLFPVSCRTRAGVDTLRAHLDQKAQFAASRHDDGHFRLAVDRSFVLRGIGTVITGTVRSGEVRVGDKVVVAPRRHEARVRSIHAQDRAADVGSVGQRCALHLVGVAKDDVGRGDWIVDPAVALASERIDARVSLLDDEASPLRSGATVHLHVGAAHVVSRVVVLAADVNARVRGDEVAPGATAWVQFIPQAPIAAWRGDRCIVRDASATRTIGGGSIIDPLAPARYRRAPERLQILAALGALTPAAQLQHQLASAPLGVDLKRFALSGNVRDVAALLAPLRVRRVRSEANDFAIGGEQWLALQQRVQESLVAFHVAHVDETGPDAARLRRIALPKIDEALYAALIADLVAEGKVARRGPWLHAPGHDNAPSAQERAIVDGVLPRLRDAAFDPPWVRDLARDHAQPERLMRTAMIRASKRGELFQVVRDLFFHPAAISDLAAVANALQEADGEVRAATFRDATGLGRKRAIHVLEFFDRVGFTRRIRDKHIVRAADLLAFDANVGGTRGGAGGRVGQSRAIHESNMN